MSSGPHSEELTNAEGLLMNCDFKYGFIMTRFTRSLMILAPFVSFRLDTIQIAKCAHSRLSCKDWSQPITNIDSSVAVSSSESNSSSKGRPSRTISGAHISVLFSDFWLCLRTVLDRELCRLPDEVVLCVHKTTKRRALSTFDTQSVSLPLLLSKVASVPSINLLQDKTAWSRQMQRAASTLHSGLEGDSPDHNFDTIFGISCRIL